MTTHPTLLFVYGTLHPDRAPAAIALAAKRLIPTGPATVRGRITHFEHYPALHLDPDADPIPGHLFELPNDPTLLAALDDYEGFRPEKPHTSLFLRQLTHATAPDGTLVTCWAYVYNHPLP